MARRSTITHERTGKKETRERRRRKWGPTFFKMNEKNGSPRVPPSDLVMFTMIVQMAKDGP
jgi:hypothetical protein